MVPVERRKANYPIILLFLGFWVTSVMLSWSMAMMKTTNDRQNDLNRRMDRQDATMLKMAETQNAIGMMIVKTTEQMKVLTIQSDWLKKWIQTGSVK